MGEAITRLNPQIESRTKRTFLTHAINLVLKITMLFPEQTESKRGPKPYDYRMILALCIFRILFKKSYTDYEIEMRTDSRFCEALSLAILPGKSTLQRFMAKLDMNLLRTFNKLLIENWTNKKLNISIDASGIRIVGRSIWYSIRTKMKTYRRDCDKVHLAICNDTMLILNWFVTEWKKNDSPFFIRLLLPFKNLGIILADAGYLSRKNFQFVTDKNGVAFIPFKSNSTAKPKSHPAWKIAFNLWKTVRSIYKGIYHQRSKVECIFSALKKRYGDQLHGKKKYLRRREMVLRFIAYNIRLIIYLNYAIKNDLNLWVRAKKR